jgi:hypothetical protein
VRPFWRSRKGFCMPYMDFVAGQPLTAAEVDTYLMRQATMTFASAAARDAALAAVLDEGMVAYLEDSNSLTYYTGAAWVVVSEPPQALASIATFQGISVSNTMAYGWTQRCNGMFVAQFAANITSGGSAPNDIAIATPFTLPDAEAIGGAYTYTDTGTAVYSGSIYPFSTTEFRLQSDTTTNRLGTSPNFAMANTDVLRVTLHGRYV